LRVLQPVDHSFRNQNLLHFVPVLAADLGGELFLSLDDFLVLPVPAQLEVDFGLEAGDVDLTLSGLAQFFWLLVSHLAINS